MPVTIKTDKVKFSAIPHDNDLGGLSFQDEAPPSYTYGGDLAIQHLEYKSSNQYMAKGAPFHLKLNDCELHVTPGGRATTRSDSQYNLTTRGEPLNLVEGDGIKFSSASGAVSFSEGTSLSKTYKAIRFWEGEELSTDFRNYEEVEVINDGMPGGSLSYTTIPISDTKYMTAYYGKGTADINHCDLEVSGGVAHIQTDGAGNSTYKFSGAEVTILPRNEQPTNQADLAFNRAPFSGISEDVHDNWPEFTQHISNIREELGDISDNLDGEDTNAVEVGEQVSQSSRDYIKREYKLLHDKYHGYIKYQESASGLAAMMKEIDGMNDTFEVDAELGEVKKADIEAAYNRMLRNESIAQLVEDKLNMAPEQVEENRQIVVFHVQRERTDPDLIEANRLYEQGDIEGARANVHTFIGNDIERREEARRQLLLMEQSRENSPLDQSETIDHIESTGFTSNPENAIDARTSPSQVPTIISASPPSFETSTSPTDYNDLDNVPAPPYESNGEDGNESNGEDGNES